MSGRQMLQVRTARETPGIIRANWTKSLPFKGSSLSRVSFTVAPSSEAVGLHQRDGALYLYRFRDVVNIQRQIDTRLLIDIQRSSSSKRADEKQQNHGDYRLGQHYLGRSGN